MSKKTFTGILLLAILCSYLTITLSILSFKEIILPFSFDSRWLQISDLTLRSYNRSWVKLIWFEFILNIVQTLGLVFISILFFRKLKIFPTSLIIFVMAKTLLITTIFYLHTVIKGPPTPTFDVILGSNFKIIVVAFIWVPYFLLSEKVKDTFIY